MADTFGGLSLNVLMAPMGREQAWQGEVVPIPGGNTAYLDLAGTQPEVVTLNLWFSAYADYAALRALLGTQGTLVTIDGAETAVLQQLGRVPNTWLPGETFDARATFVIVA